jgi:hypothetical protein
MRARISVPRLMPWLVAVGLLALYLSTLTAGNTYDAVIYAQFVERVASGGGLFTDFFNPAHVAHLPVATAITWALQRLSVPVGGMLVLQLLAALAGAAMGGFMVTSLAEDTGLPLAVMTSIAAALAAGTWFFATDGETNHLGLALALAALGPLRAVLNDPPRRATIVSAGLLLGASATFHLTVGTLWIALLVLAIVAYRERLRAVVATLAVASVLLGLAYVPRVIMLEQSTPDWRLVHVISFAADSPGGGYLLREGFAPRAEWLALARSFGPDAGLATIAASILPWLWLLAGLAALVLRRGGVMLRLAALWFAATLALYAAWAGQDFEFACFMTTPLAILGACGVAALLPTERGRLRAALATAGFATIVGVAAWRGTIAPKLDPASNPYRALAEMVAAATAQEDIVLASEVAGNPTKIYLSYYAGRVTVIPEFFFGPRIDTSESLRRLRARLVEHCARGQHVFALPELIEPMAPERAAALDWDFEAVRGALLEWKPEPAVIDQASGRVLLYRLPRCPAPG